MATIDFIAVKCENIGTAAGREVPDMNLILIGMMGCGKSTCGYLLAQRLGWTLVDTDQLIQQRDGRTIPEIFAQDGEGFFRDLESAAAMELSAQDGLVIATGGGIILRDQNVIALRSSGIVVWLNRSAEDIFDSESMEGRPLAQDGKAAFLDRFAQREEKYRAAAHIIIEDFSSPQATVERILEQLPSSFSTVR